MHGINIFKIEIWAGWASQGNLGKKMKFLYVDNSEWPLSAETASVSSNRAHRACFRVWACEIGCSADYRLSADGPQSPDGGRNFEILHYNTGKFVLRLSDGRYSRMGTGCTTGVEYGGVAKQTSPGICIYVFI